MRKRILNEMLADQLSTARFFPGAKVTETDKESIFSFRRKLPMPGDTLVITPVGASSLLSDTFIRHQPVPLPGNAGATEPSLFFFAIGLLASVIAVPFIIHWLWEKNRQQKIFKAAQANFVVYDQWLTTYNGYYKTLPVALRQRFLERVAWFMSVKTFTGVNLTIDEKMPLLISAASVQISFGLDKYLLDFFDTIYILQHNYNYGLYNQPFEGHVNSNGIYLSWDNFLRGYEDYTDADNVGIHEMAHALAYVNFMAGANDGQDSGFIKRFYDFSAVARPVFNEMQTGNATLLNAYAATNYNEFWAVAVETFFERPLHLKFALPALYTALCSLLNQDPLLPEKLLQL